jgi:surface antigen
MKKTILAAALVVSMLAVTACNSTQGWGQKQGVGTVGGAVAGGLAGSAFGQGTGKLIAVGAGTLIGAWLGNEIGSSLDNADRAALMNAQTNAYTAPIGKQIAWNNSQSGNSGVIVPVRDGYDQGGAYCREFQQKVTVGGQTKNAYGTACEQPDGSWKIVQ